MKFFAVILSLTQLACVKCQTNRECYQNNDNPYSFFASKTAYSLVSAKQHNVPLSKLNIIIFRRFTNK